MNLGKELSLELPSPEVLCEVSLVFRTRAGPTPESQSAVSIFFSSLVSAVFPEISEGQQCLIYCEVREGKSNVWMGSSSRAGVPHVDEVGWPGAKVIIGCIGSQHVCTRVLMSPPKDFQPANPPAFDNLEPIRPNKLVDITEVWHCPPPCPPDCSPKTFIRLTVGRPC